MVARSQAAYERVGMVAEIIQQRLSDVASSNPLALQQRPIVGLRQVRLAAKDSSGLFNRLVEGQVLKRMQRVVMDEGRDRPLRRQETRSSLNHLAQFSKLGRIAVGRSAGRDDGRLLLNAHS